MYDEVNQPGYKETYIELRAHVAPGERRRFAVLQVHGRLEVWRGWLGGHAARARRSRPPVTRTPGARAGIASFVALGAV